jgi:hypothetical protein
VLLALVLLACAAVSTLIEEHHGSSWLSTLMVVLPTLFVIQLMEPFRQRRLQARRAKRAP